MGCGRSKVAATRKDSLDQGSAKATDAVESKDVHMRLRVRRQQHMDISAEEKGEICSIISAKMDISIEDVVAVLEKDDDHVYVVKIKAKLENNTKEGRQEKQVLQNKGRKLQNACLSGELFLEHTNGMIIGVAMEGESLPPENVAFTDALFTETIKDLWNTADKDKSGSLDALEFVELMMNEHLGLDLEKQQIKDMCVAVDADQNGMISYDEFVPLATEIITRIFKNLAFSKTNSWCQLWSLKTMTPPDDSFIQYGRRKTIAK